MTVTNLWLIRHAEVELDYQRVFGGRIDMGISPEGQCQAAALAGWLGHQPLDAVYASPMKRVQQTLLPITRNGTPRPVIETDLREVDFGDWTGHGWEAVLEKFGIHAADWLDHLDDGTVPNGETGVAFRGRVEPVLRRILQRHPGGHVGIAAHGGVIRMMLAVLLDLPLRKTAAFEIDYASVTHIEHGARRAEVRLLNFTPWRDIRA